MDKRDFYKLVWKILALFVAEVFLCRYTRGYALLAVPIAVLGFALTAKTGSLIISTMFLPFLVMTNPVLMPRYASFSQIARLTSFFAQFILIFSGAIRPGKKQLPFGGLFPYLVIAIISSMIGYFPLISYLKLANFVVFLLSIYIGTRNMGNDPNDMKVIRAGLLAFSAFLVFGSLLTLPFPSIAYFTSLKGMVAEYGAAYVDYMYSTPEEGQLLFTGVTVHSQFLGPVLACVGAWVLLDLLYLEGGKSLFHALLLLPIPVMLFMTKSRIGLVTLVAAMAVIMLYCLPGARIAKQMKARVALLMSVCVAILLLAGVVAEVRGGYMTKWVRKTNEVERDDRSMTTAMTESRQGVIGESMRDFHRNIILGKGFQVVEEHRDQYNEGRISLFSAPIEKGVLPVMILGETGIIGELFFFVFLVMFYAVCSKKGYRATATMFTVMLATNLAEATFFSPGGGGGVHWMLCVIGGFAIDLALLDNLERQGA